MDQLSRAAFLPQSILGGRRWHSGTDSSDLGHHPSAGDCSTAYGFDGGLFRIVGVVIVAVKLLRQTPEKRYKWEVIKDYAKLAHSVLPMVLVHIPMFNEKEVYQWLIRAGCELSWPSDRIIIQVLGDSTIPTINQANSDECIMTRLQEMSLDYHFTIEQEVGSSTHAFFGFNGTTRVWRIAAIDEAGGWKDQTTWIWPCKLVSRGGSSCTSATFKLKHELPSTFKAFGYQQHRWSCGPANLFRKVVMEIARNKKVTSWTKGYVIYSFFFVRKITAINTFLFLCIVLPATVFVPEVAIPKWEAVYIPTATTIINAVGTPKSFYLTVFWIMFENVMLLHRAKATLIGSLDGSRANELVVTEKLGNILKGKAAASKPNKKPRFRIGDRIHIMELGVGAYLFSCGCYDVFFGKNYFIFLFVQSLSFFIVGFGYVGTIVPNP